MLTIRFNGILLILFLLIIPLSAQEQDKSFLSLDAAIHKALRQNNLIKADQFALQKATWNKRHAWALLLPSVTLNSRYNWIDDSTFVLRDFSRYFRSDNPSPIPGFNFDIPQTVFQQSYYTSFDVNMSLFNGIIWNGIQYAAAAKRLAIHQLTATQNTTVFQVISTYLNALYAKDILDLQKEYLDLSNQNFKKAERMQKAGRYSRLEVLRWKVDSQQQLVLVSQSASAQRSALSALKRVTASPMKANIRIENHLPIKLVSESKKLERLPDTELLSLISLSEDELLQANAALSAVKSSEEMSRLYYHNSFSNFLPNINLNYSYAWRENNTVALDDYSPQMLSVSLSWPLFTGFQDYSSAKANYYDYKRSEQQYENQLQNVHFTLTETVNKLINLKAQIALSETNVEISENNYTIVADQKEKGLVSNIAFIDAKLSLQNAKLSHLKNQYDFISAMVELYYLTGKLEKLL